MAGNPKLTVLHEQFRGKVFELDKEVMSAGRKEGTDICIKDPSLSSHHCDFIRNEKGNYVIRDNNSTNGTRVNNEPVFERELKGSDIVQLGGVEMLYDAPVSKSSADLGRTHTIALDNLNNNPSTIRALSNLSPFAEQEQKKMAMANKMMKVIIALLALGVVCILLYVILKMAGAVS